MRPHQFHLFVIIYKIDNDHNFSLGLTRSKKLWFAVLVLWGLGLVGGGGEVSSWLTNGSFLFAEKTRITITTEGSQYVILEPSLFSVLGERQSLRFNIVRDIPPDFHSTCSHWQRMYLTRVGRVCVKVSSCKVDCWSMTRCLALQLQGAPPSHLSFHHLSNHKRNLTAVLWVSWTGYLKSIWTVYAQCIWSCHKKGRLFKMPLFWRSMRSLALCVHLKSKWGAFRES